MKIILDTYLEHQDWIKLIKDIVFLFGAYYLIRYIFNKNFTDKSKAIRENLESRAALENHLTKYVLSKHKNNVEIAVRFVHWKNYPYNLENDAFKHELFTYPKENGIMPSGYIDNTGINIVEHTWFCSQSTYVDKKGIFFIASKGQYFSDFKEFQNTVLVLHLPYTNIVNYDFREIIEYEPVIYITAPYTNFKKLYDDKVVMRNKPGEEYLNINLNQKNMMKKHSWLRYQSFKFKMFLSNYFSQERKNKYEY